MTNLKKISLEYKNTNDILKCISRHLSSREYLRKVQYEVYMYSNLFKIYPKVYVFPDIHRRNASDKELLELHIMKYHYADIIRQLSDDTISIDNVCNGVYIYEISVSSKRRRWIRIQ